MADESEKEESAAFENAQLGKLEEEPDMESGRPALSGSVVAQDLEFKNMNEGASDVQREELTADVKRLEHDTVSGDPPSGSDAEAMSMQVQDHEGGTSEVMIADTHNHTDADSTSLSGSHKARHSSSFEQGRDDPPPARQLDDLTRNEEQPSARTSDESSTGRPRTATLSETLLAAQSVIQEQSGKLKEAPSAEPESLQPPHHRASIASNASIDNPTTRPTTIYGVVVVGFNHSLGPIVDYSYPTELQHDKDIVGALPFLALPDGAHMVRLSCAQSREIHALISFVDSLAR